MDMGKRENIAPCQGYVGWADDMYDYPIEDASDYALCDEKFFPAIDTAIALNELNYKM